MELTAEVEAACEARDLPTYADWAAGELITSMQGLSSAVRSLASRV